MLQSTIQDKTRRDKSVMLYIMFCDCSPGKKRRRLLRMAALFDVSTNEKEGGPLHSFAVITVDAHQKLSSVHDRMPVSEKLLTQCTEKQKYKQTDILTDRQTDRQTDTRTGRHTNRQIHEQTDTRTDRHTNRQTDR